MFVMLIGLAALKTLRQIRQRHRCGVQQGTSAQTRVFAEVRR